MARMRRNARWSLAIVAGALACATGGPPSYPIAEEETLAKIRTVALAPPFVAFELSDTARVRALIVARVTERLREGGFEVVPPDEWDRRWLAIAREVGEVYDPVTGEANDERYRAVLSAFRHDLAVERGAGATVRVRVEGDVLEASGPSPLFCGIQRDVYWPDDSLPGNVRVTSAFGACLDIAVFDLDDHALYHARYGVEFEETYALQTHASRPIAERLRDAALVPALDAVLAPLAGLRHASER
jgi:hypothetical protein